MSKAVGRLEGGLRPALRRQSGRMAVALAVGLLAAVAGSARLCGQTVTLQAIADSTIKQESPNQSFGAQATLVVKEGGSRVLVRFDPAAIGAAVGGGSLASAQLRLYIGTNGGNWGTTGRTVDVYRADASWTEMGATWNCAVDANPANSVADCATPWNGGTIEDDATDTVVVTNTSSGWIQFDVTADVQAFLAGTANDGWLLEKTDEGQGGRVDLVSREGSAGQGPQLVLISQSAAVDTVPPAVAIVAPAQPVLVNMPSPPIAVAYQDGGSGVDTSTLRVVLDGQDLTAGCTVGAQSASCTSPALAAGAHTVTANVQDHAGNAATASRSFQLFLGPAVSTLTLPAVADTYITGAAPDKEHGRAAILRVAKSGPRRALVQFDPAALAAALAGSQLLSAQLELAIAANGNNWGTSGRTVGVYPMTVAWSEAAATWDCPADTNLDNHQPDCAARWNGGAFAASPTATALLTRDLGGTLDFDVTADVAAFLAGTASDGWLLKKTDEAASGRADFVSREAGSGQAAQLVVVFQVPAPDTTPPTLTITSPADGSYSRTPSIQVTGTIGGTVAAVTVGGQPASLAQGGFTASVTLVQGANVLVAVATDAAGNQASATALVTLDTTPPTLTLTTPSPGQLTNQPQVQVAGSATDDSGIATLTVGGQPVTLAASGKFSTLVPVGEGVSSIEVDAVDLAGNQQTVVVSVNRFSIPTVAIVSPPDLSYVNATTVTVSGTVGAAVTVSVNGVAAAVSGNSFTAAGVPLAEGGNSLTATATDAQGHVGLATINVVRDLTPPHVAIYTPAAGATVGDSAVAVSGLVNDIVAGTVNAGNVQVTVNGVPAVVANRAFLAPAVRLQPGTNVLTAVAVDASGNQAQTSVTVQQARPAAPSVAVVLGGGQSAVIGTVLAQPLVAVVQDAVGQPVPGKTVLFRVRGGNGTLDGGRRDLGVTSDANGQALVHFTLGTRAGAGNQVVEASAVGSGPPAVFLASALPGAPALIVVDSGDQQLGVAGQALPRPLAAAVVDAGGNRLAEVAASFRVVKGAGQLANGQQTMALTTDSDGRLIAALTTDPAEGVANNVVEATIDGLAGGLVASFTASTWAAGDPSLTAVSGVVLDNSNLPLAGVTIRIRDTALTAVTDAQGLFQIAPAPVGTLKLIVDGSTAQRSGAWPDLEFDLTTVPGRNNTVRMPIYLLPLDLAHGIQVDETHGGTLTLPQLPGFALQIQPGSVTFPGGGRSGVVSVTVVHSDKVPMVPNFGQQPRLIVTIQPAGALFNPPAQLTMPNVEGLAPGQVTELYSFDHDLGHFVSIGPATVSDDGSVVTSNVGVGILKAGWHCCGFPQGSGTPNSCPECTDCTGDQCKARDLCTACKSPPGPGYSCNGPKDCAPPNAILPNIADRVRLQVDKQSTQVFQCPDDPNGPPDKAQRCGASMFFNYSSVDPHCGSIDLAGNSWSETATSDYNCSGALQHKAIVIGSGCSVDPGNALTGCHDEFSVCLDPSSLPLGDCIETAQQQILWQPYGSDNKYPGETVTVVFTFHRTQSGCTGSISVTRMP